MMPLWHAAFSVRDLRRTYRWYHETLGLVFARGTNLFAGPHVSWIQGLRGVAATCWWLDDRQDTFQLEVFEYRRPLVRAISPHWRPCDIGYTSISFHVDDLDAAIGRAERQGSPPLSGPVGDRGARRVCVRDPDGILVELMEDDPCETPGLRRPRTGVPAAARCVTLSVGDLQRTRSLLVDGLGLEETSGLQLHGPGHEALWGLEGAHRDSALFRAGDVLIEAVSYREPAATPRDRSYRLSDQGLFHLGFGCFDTGEFKAVLERCLALGARTNSPVVDYGAAGGVYIVDEQGFTIELLHRHPRFGQTAVSAPRPLPRRMPMRVRSPQRLRQRRRFDRAIVIGADTPVGLELCRLLAEDDTSLWLLDQPGTATGETASRLRALTAATINCDGLDALERQLQGPAAASTSRLLVSLSRSPSAGDSAAASPLALLSRIIGRAAPGGAQHVTAIASLSSRIELLALRRGLGQTACASTFATLDDTAPGFIRDSPLNRAFSLTPREAAETIYLATLQGRRTVRRRPNPWPPRRGASETPGSGGLFFWPTIAPAAGPAGTPGR
jgi:catechol 2,3-dioxygenase-like lactoylglutathione lyase family enzyme